MSDKAAVQSQGNTLPGTNITIIISKLKIREQEVGADFLWEGPGLMPHIVSETLTGTEQQRGSE